MNGSKPISIKICGMRDQSNITEIAALNPDYLGFIFYPRSPRFVGNQFTIPALSASIKKVGVFVNESNEGILAKVNSLGLDLIQLHGDDSADQCKGLKNEGIRIIKAFALDDDFSFSLLNSFKKVVDYFLFDTRGKHYGGNARVFNWKLLTNYDQDIPFFLSGGLSPANMDQLGDVTTMNIHALDLNSGVEQAPGLKSIEKVRQAFANAPLKHQKI
jgi:phosphoribosylanthranilate isomerase